MIWEVEVEIEALKVAPGLFLNVVDMEFREDHPAFGMIGVG
jgi:hypothetical protein